MKKIIIFAPHQLADYIESVSYEKDALKELMVFAAERGFEKTEAFKHWENMYFEKNAELCVAKDTLFDKVVRPATGGLPCTWELSYKSREITIMVADTEGEVCGRCK